MLAVHFFSKRVRTQITLPYQWLNITFNGIRSSSSSSDSSSSDSDSDSARGNDNKKKLNIDYLHSAKVAHKRRQIEKELAKTALLLSNSMVKDKSKILTELLSTISNIQNETTSPGSKSTKDQNKVRDKVNLKYEKESVAEGPFTERMLQNQREMLRHVNDNDETEEKTSREQSIRKKPKERREMLRLIDDNVETEEETYREQSIRKKPKERREMLRLIDDNVETEEETFREQFIRTKPKERREMLRLIDDNVETEEETFREQSIRKKPKERREMLRLIDDNVETEEETFREQSIRKKSKERREMLRPIDDNAETEEETFREQSIRKKPKERREMLRLIDDNAETEEETSREQSIRKKPKERREMLRPIDDNAETEEETFREQSIRKKPKERREMLRLIDDNVETEEETSREQSIRKKPKERREMLRLIDDNVETEEETFLKRFIRKKPKQGITQRSSTAEMLLKNKLKKLDSKWTFEFSEGSMTPKLRTQTLSFDDIDVNFETESPFSVKSLKREQKMQSSNIRYQEIELSRKEIFVKEPLKDPNVPKFKIWDTCEEQELQSSLITYPENALQEMIKWTKEGKLWKFPIDNEQGMEEEQSVHFSKHVFLDRHLAPWCPSKGPLRHFMELVCVGLSKNPYMTIEEKYDHIMWYKDFFKDKQDLLGKLGLVE